MKKLLLSGAALFFAAATFAQDAPRYGLKAGVNLATYHGTGAFENADFKTNTGFHVTAFGDFPISRNFLIQPGVSLQNKGAKFTDVTTTAGNTTTTAEYKQNVMAIEVPVNAVLNLPVGGAGAFQINAGPYIGFNISGKNKGTGTFTTGGNTTVQDSEEDLNFGNNADDDLRSLDIGANVGLAFRTNSGFLIGGNYGIGLTNLVPKDATGSSDNKIQNRVLSFSVGFAF